MRTPSLQALAIVVAVAGCAPSGGGGGGAVVEAATDSTGGTWSCAASEFHGQQYWTCVSGALHECDASGQPEQLSCGGLGCHANPAGIDDQCFVPSQGWSCGSSRGSDGQQWLTCSGDGNVHECEADGTPVQLVCANGCVVNPANTNDACKGIGGAIPTHVHAAAGNGWAVVRWSPSGSARSGFTITASPGGASVHVGASATSATVGGLAAGTMYSFGVSQDTGTAASSNSVVPGADANIITDVVHHPQQRNLTCEEASLVMALSHERISRSEDDVLVAMGIDWTEASWDGQGNLHWGDPYAHFVGSPDGDETALTGYGVYAPPIARAAMSFGADVLVSGFSSPQALYAALLSGHPAVAWVTTDWSHRARLANWITDDGNTIGWYGPHEHAVAVVGVERDWVIVDNPLAPTEWQRVSKTTFEAAFATFGDMLVVLY